MKASIQAPGTPAGIKLALWVRAGEDRFVEHRGLRVSAIQFNVTPAVSSSLLILD